MSAFLCSNEHLNALACYAAEQRLLPYMRRIGTEMTVIEAGQLLYDQNVRSLVARYDDECEDNAYEYAPDTKPRTAVEIIKLCHCYDYQACETEDWAKTDAYELVRLIENRAMTELPGYNAAPWGL